MTWHSIVLIVIALLVGYAVAKKTAISLPFIG